MRDPEDNEDTTTAERVAQYQALMPLLEAMFREFRELAKKKPDGALNKRKVAMVNRLLKDVLAIVEDEPSRLYLDLLEEDDLPQNSDVLLILSQFDAAMKAFHSRYYRTDPTTFESQWNIE
jgi:hypothetical protein